MRSDEPIDAVAAIRHADRRPEASAVSAILDQVNKRYPVDFSKIPPADQARVQEKLRDELRKHVDEVTAELYASPLAQAASFDGMNVVLKIDVPLRKYPADHVPSADDADFMRSDTRYLSLSEGVPAFLDAAREWASRRPRWAQAEARARIREQKMARRRQQLLARQDAERERLAAWRANHFERALFLLAERVAESPDEQKALRDPVALIRAIASAVLREPVEPTHRIPDAAVAAFGFSPLPEIED